MSERSLMHSITSVSTNLDSDTIDSKMEKVQRSFMTKCKLMGDKNQSRTSAKTHLSNNQTTQILEVSDSKSIKTVVSMMTT